MIMRNKRVFQEIIRKAPIINKIRIKLLILSNISNKRWVFAQKNEKEYWEDCMLHNESRSSGIYESYWQDYITFIKGYINFKSSDNIIDIGCGAYGLINYINIGNRIGLDSLMDYYLSEFEMSKDVKYIKANGEDIPFEDGFFDVVITTNTLDHVKDIKKVLNEINRVLREGAVMILTVTCYSFIHQLQRRIMERIGKGDNYHPFSFNSNQLEKILKNLGFDIVANKPNLRYVISKRFGWTCKPKPTLKGIIYSKTIFKIEKWLDPELSDDMYMKDVLYICRKSKK